ncbi:NADP-dependent oxidoreductase domain-containing protein [Armillaria fumosa]|nr:NADP-dependent oxidoreductase domain-containing protein [Armillaria fumosa]
MSVVTLGSSKLKVSKIILGCALYGSPDWLSQVQSEEESIKQIKAAHDAGINIFDTSNVYSNEQSEVVLDGIVVMTKVFHPMSLNIDERVDGKEIENADTYRYANQYHLTREHIFDSIKKSLERLQLDYIDVLHCQQYDTNTPIHETVRVFVEVKQTPPSGSLPFDHSLVIAPQVCKLCMMRFKQGEPDMWECQTVAPGNVRSSLSQSDYVLLIIDYAVNNDLTLFISMQNDYNLLCHENEHEMMPTLKYLDPSFLPLTPLVHGAMTMPLDQQLALTPDSMIPGGRKEWHNTVITRLEEIALQKNVTMTQVAIA